MPSQLSWYLENRVILITSHGEISEQEMFDLDQPIINYLDQSDATLVHCIMDHTKSIATPSFNTSAQIKASTKLKWPKHPRYGWAIMVGPMNPLMRFVAVVAMNFFKARQRIFNTMDEALDFLNDIDSTLPPLRDNKLDKAS